MKTDETATRIAIQPETELEQQLLTELFTRLNNIQPDGTPHPDKVGSRRVYYTLDIPEYDLDLDLYEEAECGVNEHGQLEPEPGSRALIIAHSDEVEDASDGAPTQEEVDAGVEAVKESVEEGQETATGPQTSEELMEDNGFEDAIDDEDDNGPGLPFRPDDKTVDWIREDVRDSDYTMTQLRDLHKVEVNGKARTTALDAFESAMDDLAEEADA